MKSLKTKALEWIKSLYENHSFSEKGTVLYFKLEGFADEPNVYIRPTNEGLEFGFEGTKWYGHTPSPYLYKKHILIWKNIEGLNIKDQQEIILDLLMKIINNRKRQYRKCQFCGKKFATEHRFDKDTCHNCASIHFGVLY